MARRHKYYTRSGRHYKATLAEHRRRPKSKRGRRISRKKRTWISKKIRYLIVHEGRSPKQAAAIAYSMAGVARKRRK